MSEKEKILEAWIMVEHLSEGSIKKSDKSLMSFDDLEGNDYYSLFQKKILEKRFKKEQRGGMVVYFDIFDFNEIVNFLCQLYNLKLSEEEVETGFKFGLALYFDKNLNFQKEMTFLTESGYIRYFRKMPREEGLRAYERELKTKLEQFFLESAENPEKFNQAIEKVLTLHKAGISLSDCKIQMLQNMESDAVNLHSFFISDLEKAKGITTQNLDNYLLGKREVERRTNLDSKSDSVNFNVKSFEDILQPENYPLGRFPSNTEYALSFMQQVAVNLSIGCDNSQIRSVNGPPGTGKTTLLKDIFAELVVRQAHDICKLPQKHISGTSDTRYYDKATIGIIPEHITENNIVVASANNSAVQNIVNELPLISGIDKEMIEQLKEADYFRGIANSSVTVKRNEEKIEIKVVPKDEEVSWGLFSLEGGCTDNMINIVSNLRAVEEYLQCEYEGNDAVYEEFENQYKKVELLRKNGQDFADKYNGNKKKYRNLVENYKNEVMSLNRAIDEIQKKKNAYEIEKNQLEQYLQGTRQNIAENEKDKNSVMQYLQILKAEKPGLFSKRSIKRQYRCNVSEAQTSLGELLQKELNYKVQLQEYEKQCLEMERKIACEGDDLSGKQHELRELNKKTLPYMSGLEERISMADEEKNPLKMDLPYDDLQISNPWFNQEYRIAQSKLFIMALRVRKQFLYENYKNIRAAINIWTRQSNYIEKKVIIEAAWNWINMTIPVISSTFSSFGSMCRYLNENTLGHLFIDEAGQAPPQAGVGAIFRSKYVMAVGDPAQIKPVLTLNVEVLNVLKNHFGVSEKYLSDSASIQVFVDAVSKFGYYRDKDKAEDSWIGIPLWVHRRCLNPMFTISNRISYQGLMVQGMDGNGKTGWYDIKGNASDKYVAEQGEFLVQKIKKMIAENPDINDRSKKDVIYVITPFKNVAYELSQKLKKIGFTRYNEKKKTTNIGTIHTFQGKEAPIVFLVLGADRNSKGAAEWAVKEPNLINVAATRAKKEFYIIGDKELYLGIGSTSIRETYNVIQEYKQEHPENIFE